MNNTNYIEKSSKNGLIVLLLCFFLGGLGIHRFYVGKIKTGILWLLTFGFFGIGTIVDMILIVMSKFEDSNGFKISFPGKLTEN